MNPISRLIGTKTARDEDVAFEDLTAEEQAKVLAEEKAARVKFHRDEVRNGPVKWKTLSPGRQASRQRRHEAATNRKLNRKHRGRFIEGRLETAVLRGHLQALGLIEGGGDIIRIPASQRTNILLAITSRYGSRHEDGSLIIADEFVGDALNLAVADYRKRTGQPAKASA